jgi:uncharacterized protein DUF1569
MKSLLDRSEANAINARIATLSPASQRQWGKMTVGQAMAHSVIGLEMAVGDQKLPRVWIGYILGPLVKGFALKDDAPMKKNSPTAPSMRMREDRELEAEQAKLMTLVNRFVAGGRTACTAHPHPFFGRLTPDQWGVLMYKHLDHHLRQFGV